MATEQAREHAQPKTRDGQDNGTERNRAGDFLKAQVQRSAETMAKVIDIHKVIDIQKQNAELTAERVKSLVTASVAYGRGLHDMQLAYVDMVVRSLELLQRSSRDLATCSNPAAAAELQRELLRESMDQLLEGVTKVLQASSQAADQASQPIHEHLSRLAS